MKQKECYVGFPPLKTEDEIVDALVNDPPELRWRVVRGLFRIADKHAIQGLIERLRPYLTEVDDFRVKYRITIALQALHHTGEQDDYTLIRGKGVQKNGEAEPAQNDPVDPAEFLTNTAFFPIVDFHIHPKMPDMRFFTDLRRAGVTHGVILATDTDPSDVDRPEIKNGLEKAYSGCAQAARVPFEKILGQIRASLFSPTHVTNFDVADWVSDYPDTLIGFGSVNLSKDRDYVERKLDEIKALGLKGIKLLPYSQFFNPSQCDNVNLLFDYCRDTNSIVLSHAGCGAGPFEILELSQSANPIHWEPVLKKYPDVPLVLAHCGAYSSLIPGIWLHETLKLGKKYRNLYADLAAVDWILDKEMVPKEIRKTMSFDRILFGTDYPLPLTAGVSLEYLVNGLKANSLLTEKEKSKVLGQNACRLLGI
jgi:predicted TIM-barrel fold metal-dependent hydrolase